ncbi:MAG: hypothetical protein C4308_08115 [Chitinophagaceae bacterium]
MNKPVFFFFLFFLPVFLSAQTIHGLWSGTLTNDSTGKQQNFEMGLSEARGKITGYTYTTFIENDTFYYSIKKVKAERVDGMLIVEDVEMVGNNFPERAAKKVKQTTLFPLINDTTIDVSKGTWNTNKTKTYYSLTGKAALKEDENESNSDLLAHLEEMKVKTNIAARKPQKNESITKTSIAQNKKTEPTPVIQQKNETAKNSSTPQQTNNTQTLNNNLQNNTQPVIQKNEKEVVISKPVSESKQENQSLTKSNNFSANDKTSVSNNSPALEQKPVQDESKKPQQQVINQPVVNHNQPQNASKQELKKEIIVQPKTEEKKTMIAANNNVVPQPVAKETKMEQPKEQKTFSNTSIAVNNNQPVIAKKKSAEQLKPLPQIVSTRKTETIQDIYFKADSLVLSLYDNGIVDGDTVSVFLNGAEIISKQKLKESATKKTIYITRDMPDQLELVLFAENLGTIPPNTGLLTIRDGDNLYQVRFSADLSKNASIMLKRKKL